MAFEVKGRLSLDELENGLKQVQHESLASHAMGALTSGIFLVAFGLLLGASNLVIGLMAAIPSITQLVQIFGVALVERVRNRKRITVVASLLARLCLVILILAPFASTREGSITMLLCGLALHTAFTALAQCAWGSWMKDLVPDKVMSLFYSERMFYTKSLSIFLSLVSGYYLFLVSDLSQVEQLHSYSMLFIVGMALGIVGVYYMYQVPEPMMAVTYERKGIGAILMEPLSDGNFRKLLLFLGSWNFAVNLAAPFFTVYMIRRLEMNMALVVVFSVLSQICHLMVMKSWGRFTHKYGAKSAIKIAGPVYLMCVLAWTFTTLPSIHYLSLALLTVIHVFLGAANAGVTLGVSGLGLRLSPAGKATPYLAMISLTNAVTAGVAPILGGMFTDYAARMELTLILKWTSPGAAFSFNTLDLQHWDFFFLFAFFLGFFALMLLNGVEEKGEIKENATWVDFTTEVVRELRNFSTLGGLRQMVQFPFGLLKHSSPPARGDGQEEGREPGSHNTTWRIKLREHLDAPRDDPKR